MVSRLFTGYIVLSAKFVSLHCRGSIPGKWLVGKREGYDASVVGPGGGRKLWRRTLIRRSYFEYRADYGHDYAGSHKGGSGYRC